MKSELLILNKLLRRLLRAWPIFLVAIVAWSIVGLITASLSPDLYKSEVNILIEEPYRLDDPQRWILGEQRFNEPERSYIVNEGIRMKGLSLVREAMDNTGIAIQYFVQGLLVDDEQFESHPFYVELKSDQAAQAQLKEVRFFLEFQSSDKFTIQASDEIIINEEEVFFDEYKVYEYNQLISIGSLHFSLQPNLNVERDPSQIYGFQFHDPQELALDLMEEVEIEAEQIEASIFTASLTLSSKNKAKSFLIALSDAYVKLKINERKQVLDSILNTINEEIESISGKLASQENSIQHYKSTNEINSLEDQGRSLLEEITLLEGQLADIKTHQEYLSYLKNYLEQGERNSSLVSPSAYGLSDPTLNALNAEYNDLIIQKTAYLSSNQQHPNLEYIDIQLAAKAKNIKEIIEGFTSSYSIREKNIIKQTKTLKTQYATLPSEQLELLRQERSFNSLDFNFRALNQRKAEVEIALASLAADVKIIEPAYNTTVDPFFPDPVIIAAFVILLSMITPFAYLFFQSLLNQSIREAEDITDLFSTNYHQISSFNSKKSNLKARSRKEIKLLCSQLQEGLEENKGKLITLTHYREEKMTSQISTLIREQLTNWKLPVLSISITDETVDNTFSLKDLLTALLEGKDIRTFASKHTSKLNLIHLTVCWGEEDGTLNSLEKEILQKLKEQYQLIIIDLPDYYEYPDASILHQLSDEALLITRYGSTRINDFDLLQNSLLNKQLSHTLITDTPPLKISISEIRKLLNIEGFSWFYLSKMLFKRI